MQCTSCSEEIPEDSIFCPECGSRQDLSRANFGAETTTLGGEEGSGARSHGVVSSEAIAFEREARENEGSNVPSGLVTEIAANLAQQTQQEAHSNVTSTVTGDYSANDAMVDRINEAEKNIKSERRNAWLEMNKATASSVLSQINSDLPSHLKNDQDAASNIASQFLQSTVGGENQSNENSNIPELPLLRRMTEVAIRRIARKRGVAVESPQIQLIDDLAEINVTFIDDGRVLDSPSDLAQAFNHAISTEIALKGFEISANLVLFRSKDGDVEKVWGSGSNDPEEEEEMFACEACGALVKASDSKCQGCGAQFEDDVEPEGPPQGPPRGGPPGGPSRGPPRGGPPGGPSRGPPRGGPPRAGPGGPSRGPPRGGPKGPKRR